MDTIEQLDVIEKEIANKISNDNIVTKVYEKYEHLDTFLSDEQWLSDDEGRPSHTHQVLYDLWQTIKALKDNNVPKK